MVMLNLHASIRFKLFVLQRQLGIYEGERNVFGLRFSVTCGKYHENVVKLKCSKM